MAKPVAQVINTVCALDDMRVETAEGLFLGHVFDLRCSWRPGGGGRPAIDEIIYGATGLLERVGFRPTEPRSIPWSAVQSIQDKVIVVRSDRALQRERTTAR
jgi:sporulation protein YlmC with PRC-barrel domain